MPAETPIVASFRWAPEDTVLASRYLFRTQVRFAFRLLFALLLASLLVVSLYILWTKPFDVFFLILAVACFWALFLRRFEVMWWAKKRARKGPPGGRAIRWEFRENGVHVDTQDVGKSKIEWTGISNVAQSKDGFLVFFATSSNGWIPNAAFESEKDLSAFVTLLGEKKVAIRSV